MIIWFIFSPHHIYNRILITYLADPVSSSHPSLVPHLRVVATLNFTHRFCFFFPFSSTCYAIYLLDYLPSREIIRYPWGIRNKPTRISWLKQQVKPFIEILTSTYLLHLSHLGPWLEHTTRIFETLRLRPSLSSHELLWFFSKKKSAWASQRLWSRKHPLSPRRELRLEREHFLRLKGETLNGFTLQDLLTYLHSSLVPLWIDNSA